MEKNNLLNTGTCKKVSYNTKYGAEIYRRSLTVLLQCAIEELYPDLKIQVGQSLMKGYFFELPPDKSFPAQFIKNVDQRMRHIVGLNERFRKVTVSKEEAIRLYKKKGRIDKAKSIAYLRNKNIELIFLRKYFDFLLAECVAGTKFLRTFKLFRYKHGFILQFPEYGNILKLPANSARQKKLYEVYLEAKEWDRILGVQHVFDLNEAIESGRISTLIKIQEAFHEKKIGLIADRIKAFYPQKKLIIVSGPSASGKTTFIKRLGIQIRANGLIPEEISLDNYFVNRAITPRTSDGECDFESLEALEIKFFNRQIASLLAGKEITLPKYNFKTGRRERSSKKLKLKPHSIILVEGIHGLNPELSRGIEERKKYKIFVSALTQLNIDNDTRIFTSDSRLMRRIIRDAKYRGYTARETIKRFPKVREGEDKYIFPFQENADIFFNSSIIYEQAVIKPLIKKHLKEIRRNETEYFEARRLLHYLDFFQSVSSREVPQTSILREFIGESGFHY